MSVTETIPAHRASIGGVRARIFTVLSALLSVLILIQIFVAGAGLFTMAHQLDSGQNYSVAAWNASSYWGVHFLNALAITVVMLLMLGAAFVARLPGRTKKLTGLLLGLLVLQGLLGFFPWPAPLSALHVLNAFAMLMTALFVTRDNWAFGSRAK